MKKVSEVLSREEIAKLGHKSDLRATWTLLTSWGLIAACLAVVARWPNPVTIVTALVLSALGVTQKEIEADFMMSNILKDPDKTSVQIAAQVNKANGTNMTPTAVWPSLGVRKSYLEEFYKSIIMRYGSVDGYLRKGLGLTDADFETLRARYLN